MTRRRKPRRAPLDPTVRRFYLYSLTDADGEPVYIGRSCDPVARLRAHHSSGAWWTPEVVGMDVWGPYTWGRAVEVEAEVIRRERPRGNRMYVETASARPVRLAR